MDTLGRHRDTGIIHVLEESGARRQVPHLVAGVVPLGIVHETGVLVDAVVGRLTGVFGYADRTGRGRRSKHGRRSGRVREVARREVERRGRNIRGCAGALYRMAWLA